MKKIFQYCPRCGAKALKPDSAKSILCPACGFVYFFNAAAAAAAIIVNAQNELLVTIRAAEPGKGKWDLPGGFVDAGESAEQALRREVKEELNLDIDSMTYFASSPNMYEYKGVAYATLDLAFSCRVSDFSRLRAMDDITDALFVPREKIDFDRFAFGSVRTLISRYLNR